MITPAFTYTPAAQTFLKGQALGLAYPQSQSSGNPFAILELVFVSAFFDLEVKKGVFRTNISTVATVIFCTNT